MSTYFRTRQVFKELDVNASRPHLRDWISKNKKIFLVPSSEETQFISEIFAVAEFQQLVRKKQLLKGTPVADPFVIASAKIRNGCVVTEEVKKANSAKIPNVCEYFGINCMNLESFMASEKWEF